MRQPLSKALCFKRKIMDWTPLISAAGIGALLVKVIDTLWLQKVLQSAEKKKWLREKRLKAYSDLTAELLSLGKRSDLQTDAFQGYAIASEAILLTDDDKLAKEIEDFFTGLANLFKEASIPEGHRNKRSEDELEGAYEFLFHKSRHLVIQLRKCLHYD
jgi:hypothetical protein